MDFDKRNFAVLEIDSWLACKNPCMEHKMKSGNVDGWIRRR